MRTEDLVGVVGLEEIQEIGDDLSLRSFQPPPASIKNLDAGDLPGHGRISGHLQLKACQGDLKIWREPGFVSVTAREEVMLGHVALILADVDVVELGLVTGLDLDLLGNFSACIDPMALEGAKDGSEAAFLCLEAALQGLDHFPVGRRILEVHVERGRIGGSGFG